jgi:hypothetical protein
VQLVAALAGLLSVGVSLVIGLRLLLLWRRTRQLPELLIGLALLLAGGFWSALIAVGRQATGLSDDVRVAMIVVGSVCGVAGLSSFALFNWRVFRPTTSWAPAAAATLALALLGIWVAQGFSPGWLVYANQERGPWNNATWIAAASYVWAFADARLQYSMLSRRQRLGLADPVITDRMRLWTWMTATSLVASAFFATLQTLGIPVGGTPLGLSIAALAAVFTSTLLCLTFLPPAGYLESVRRRAAVEV